MHRPVRIAERNLLISTSADITEQKALEDNLFRSSYYDQLTGLPTRRVIEHRVNKLLKRENAQGRFALAFLDVDNFKRINDSYGHEAGDEAIRICARTARLEEAVTGRLGGDEFALLLEKKPLPQAIEIAEDLRLKLAARPFDTGKDRITLTWSVGVGEGRPGDTVDQILARADAALYDAKLGGRNRVVGAHASLLTRPAIVTDGTARALAV